MNLLVTGASGFIGRYVAAEALRRGHHVKAMIRPAASTAGIEWIGGTNIEVVRADLRSRPGLEKILSGVDAVIHLAVSQSDFTATVAGTENLLAAVGEAKTGRFVLISSFAVYHYLDLKRFSALDESTDTGLYFGPNITYGLMKLFQENLVRRAAEENGIQFTILRPGAVYGKGHTWTARLGMDLSDRLWIMIGGRAALPLTYVENCAEAIVMCVEQDSSIGEIFNVVDGKPPMQKEYMRLLRRRMRPCPKMIPVPLALFKTAAGCAWLADHLFFKGNARLPQVLRFRDLDARFKPLRYSNRKLEEVIGWKPRYSLEEAIERCFDARAVSN